MGSFGHQLREAWAQHQKSLEAFSLLTTLDFAAWIRLPGEHLGKLIERNAQALINREWLANWLDYVRIKRNLVEAGFGRLA
jgi:hypothetical protein